MKIILIKALFCLLPIIGFGQINKLPTVRFYVENAGILPRKITLIAYQPNENGNSTNGFFLMPGQRKEVTYCVGTKVYLATTKQVNIVMSGKRIDADQPFILVQTTYSGKVFDL